MTQIVDESGKKKEKKNLTEPKKKIIIGIGNVLRQDEGVGVWFSRYLKGKLSGFKILEAGNLSLALLPELQGCDVIIFVDALNPDYQEEYFFFEICPQMSPIKFSFHEMSIAEMLHLAELAGVKYGRVFVLGVRPHRLNCRVGVTKIGRAHV